MRRGERRRWLESAEAAVAWELRGSWASQRQVALVLKAGRVRGYVEHVAATGAYALVWDGRDVVHVPLALVLAVARPHFHEDAGTLLPRGRDPVLLGPPPHEGQLALAGRRASRRSRGR
jgi:hypothetical protein